MIPNLSRLSATLPLHSPFKLQSDVGVRFPQHGSNLGAARALKKENAIVTKPLLSVNYSIHNSQCKERTERRMNMPKESEPFEQDFVLVSQTEIRVRQATQYAQLHEAIVPIPDEDVWEWETSLEGEQVLDKHVDQEYTTVWESMLERL